MKNYAKFFSGASFVYTISNLGRNAATEAKTLDDSLVNLQKVTDEISDRDALYKYFDKSLSKAQELNVKVGSLIDAVTEFKKLGWDLDDAELGAKWANILSNVGDVDIDTAIGSIKTAIASFDEIGGYGNDQMDKKLEAYTDLINNMSNKYSIDAEGLAESIRLSAGTLTEAHMSIEQAATMFATANKYYNDPSYLGNTAKIGSLRMRASSGDTDAIEELQEMGEEVDDLATATSNLREKLMALTGVDIMEDEHTFKSYYDQLYEISQVMDKLDDTSRANVLETMFGKSRAAAGAALLSGLKSEGVKAYEDAINSAGSATEEYQVWMTSADAACQRFSNTLTETYQCIINGNTVRDLANLGSAVLEFANNWGIVEGTLKGVIALNLGKFIATGGMALITATKQVEEYGKALQMASNVPNGNLSARFQALKSIAQATSTLTTEQLRNVLATNTLTQADRVRILQMQGMTKEMALQKLAEMNLTQATNAQTAANNASTVSTFSLKAVMTGLGATIRSVFFNNPAGIVLMGISLGVSAVTSAVSKHNQAVEEARQKAKEAADNANTLSNEISELANKYIQLSEAVKTDSASKEDLMSVQEELIKKLGIEGQSVDDLIAKYGSLDNALKNITLQELGDQENDLIAGVKAAEEELKDIGKGYEHLYSSTDRNLLSSGGDDAVKAYEVLEKANLISKGSYGTGGGAFVLTGDDETVEGILENYQKLEDAMAALRESGQFTETELTKNPVFSQIYDRAKEMEEFVNGYNDAISNLNKNIAEQQTITLLQGNEIPKTEKEFETFRQELIDTSIASKKFIGNEKEITDAINNYLSTVPQFQGFYSVPLKNELDKVDELLNEPSVLSTDELKEKLSDLNSAIDSIQSAYDTLNSAVEEYNSNGGQLSIDTIQSLLSLSDEYLACLQVENGQLSLNADAMAQLAQAKLDEAQATAVTQAMTELQAIANGEAAQSTTNYITGNAALMDSLAKLSGSYDGVAQAAMTAAQAQELSAQISAAASKDKTATENVMKGLDNKLKLIQATKTTISAGNFAKVAKKSSSSKSGSSSKNYETELKKQLESIKTEYEKGSITLDEYYEKSLSLIKQYYDEGKIEASDFYDNNKSLLDDYLKYLEIAYKRGSMPYGEYFAKYLKAVQDCYDKGAISTEEYWNYNKELLDDYVDSAKKILDNLYDHKSMQAAGVSDLKQYLTTCYEMIKSFYNQGKISAYDYYNYLSDFYDYQISIYDKVIDAVTNKLDDQIDALEKQKDQIEKNYKAQIDVLEKEKDALEAENNARQDAIDLQKALYEMNRAQNQRTDLVYKDGQMVYTADQQGIRDKKNELDDLEYQQKIKEIEKQISSLEETMDSLTDGIDQQIEDLNNYKDQWEDVKNKFVEQQNELLAEQIIGKNWEIDIQNMRMEALVEFTNNYIAMQQAQADAAVAAANKIVEAQRNIAAMQNTTSASVGSVPKTTSYDNPKSSGSKTSGKNSSGNQKPYTIKTNLSDDHPSKKKKVKAYPVKGNRWYASGTDNAEKGWHIVSEDNIGDEIVIDNNGNAVIPHGEQLYNFQGGEQVIPANESKEIIENQGNIEKIPDKVVLGDGTVLTPVSYVMEISDSIRQSMMKNVALPNNIGQRNYENLMKNTNSISNVNNNQPTDNSISIGEIHLNEVQNVDELLKGIIHKFPGKMRQALYSR